ncbi:Lsr2 dimerization domain-containing protein [Streptomyces cinereoruber]|uniref:Lsr2 dimerization domain-containing protein n=1 Tax=Streptomyces cinereoruber TaxID=67260 RepID=UPI00363310D8
MTGHHRSCPQVTISRAWCSCSCHDGATSDAPFEGQQLTASGQTGRAAPELGSARSAHVETLSFAIDGTSYEVELAANHAADLRISLQPFLVAAREVRAHRKPWLRGSVMIGQHHASADGLPESTTSKHPES